MIYLYLPVKKNRGGLMATDKEMLFAVQAVKNSFITPDKVQECIDIQKSLKDRNNQDVSLDTIFLEMNYLTEEQIAFLLEQSIPESITLEKARELPEYEVTEKIDDGGVASLFRAVHKHTGAPCVIKILLPIHTLNKAFIEAFRHEAELLIRLDHANIVKGFEYDVYPAEHIEISPRERMYYFSMEIVPGQSVQDDIDELGSIEENKALHIILQVAEALEYLHENKIVHRDIKPDNILYDGYANIKLCDLGEAIEIVENRERGIENVTCGSVQYISPEQAKGLSDLDTRSDIYSLGATLFHLCTGEVPFSGKDSTDIMVKQVIESLNSEKYRDKSLSPFIGYFIEKMMAKEREIRYQTPKEVIKDISEIIQGTKDLQYDPKKDPELGRFFQN